MQTSNFFRVRAGNLVAIARGLPKFYAGNVYDPLRPSREMLRVRDAEFDQLYAAVLASLDPARVAKDLGGDAILLCWEKPGPEWHKCHRRLVAEWLEAGLGIVVPELGFPREVVPRYVDMPLSPTWAAKQFGARQRSLF